MSDDETHDPAADTGRFQRFAEQELPPERGGSSAFRLLTLAGGLVVFAGIVWLLLR